MKTTSQSSGDHVLAIGVFDLFHVGHLRLLKHAAELGEVHVLVNGDDFTASYKRRPIIGENDRLEIIRSCRYVHRAEIAHGPCPREYIERHSISMIVHGDDWPRESYLKQICMSDRELIELGTKLVYKDYYQGESTSKIIARRAHAA